MKLIVSDLDGTLLLKGEKKLHRLIISAIEKILDDGRIFCVASGRNFSELKKILEGFEERIYFIANDGALIVHKDETICGCPIDFAKIRLFEPEKNFVAHGKYYSFVKSDSERFIRGIKEQYFGHIVRIKNVNEIDTPIYKMTLYNKKSEFEGLDRVYCDNLLSEYVENGINKGAALSTLMKTLKINEADTVVVGDGLNDIEMFKIAGNSYIMATALPKVKKMGKYVVNNFNDAVDDFI